MGINILMSKIAITYTEAFIQHAIKKLELTNITIDIYKLGQVFVNSPEFDSFLKNPLISRNEKQKVIDTAIKNSVGSETYKFLSLLIRRNRINILKEITEVYDSLVVKESKFTIVNVRIPMALTPIQKDNLEKKIRQNSPLSRPKIYVKEIIDKSLLGGFVIEMESKKIDFSIATKLKNLDNMLQIT